MPGKKLITETFILDAARTGETSVTVPTHSILTPLARDTARDRGITILFGDQTDGPTAGPPAASSRIVCLGSDHGGYEYKQELVSFLAGAGWKVVDVGTDSMRSCDYPDFAYAVAKMVTEGRAALGVMIDGAGIGSSIVCNKVPGIRAACAYSEFTAWNARAHNNANILTLGSKSLGIEVCKHVVSTFLDTEYEGGRHDRRVRKMADVEQRFIK